MVVIVLGLLLSLFPIIKTQDAAVIYSLLLAPVISAINFVVGIYLINKGFRASQPTFLKYVFGGMGARLLVLGAILAAVYLHGKFDFITFLIALMGYYISMIFLEVWYVHTRLRVKKENGE